MQKVQRLLKPVITAPTYKNKNVVSENAVKVLQSPKTTVTVKDSSAVAVKVNNSPFTSVSVVESPATSVTVVQSSSTEIKPNLQDSSEPGDVMNYSCVTDLTCEPRYPKKVKKSLINSEEDKGIRNGDMLSDMSMNEAQRLLKLQFPKIKGLQLTLLQQKHCNSINNTCHQFIKNQLQIIHCHNNHWMVASSISSSKEVYVYDSVYDSVAEELINALFCSTNIVMKKCQKQKGGVDCGLFAVANATTLASGIDPCNICSQTSQYL